MKKAILTAALTALLLLSGCTPDADGGTPESSSTGSATAAESSSIAETEADNPSEPPEITAATGDSAIPTLYRAEHWDGTIQCGTDLVTGAIQQYGADTPAGAASQSVTVTFPEGAHPGLVRILLEARDADGMPVWNAGAMTEANTNMVDDSGSVTFTLPGFETDYAYTGILIEAVWGENNAWYALALRNPDAAGSQPNAMLPLLEQ